ncbi:glycosyltransferase [Microbacterium sp. G2-8]|uniref:glycosyltransferase n=1 Tax=Microbacterium sp. G2-8 TaxID=2842454 RepID=UPI001C895225|nr:glycosyltransferase [Microbacterium sp. G2-8]
MPAPVHVVLVARSAPAAASRLERTLAALRAQTRAIDGLTIVVCGDHEPLRDAVDASNAEAAIHAPESIPFGGAVELVLPRIPDGRAAWLLDDHSAPEPDTLSRLMAALERQPSVALAAPKLVRADDRRTIESFGMTMTRFGRTVELARGEYDQGQHDRADDVLGADIRGMLMRGDVLGALAPDRALLGVDEGLDMGVRARLAGRRVALAPDARVAVWPSHQHPLTRGYVSRVARLHRRLSYAPLLGVLFQWLLLLPLALWSTAVAFLAKRPSRAVPEWMAAATVLVRVPAIVRSRAKIRHVRTGSWRQVDPLRLSRAELRERQQAAEDDGEYAREPLRFFSGGGAWAVLGSLAASIGVFAALLTWPGLAGGALLPLRSTVAGLWSDALYGLRPEGLDAVGAADPFSALIAVIGTMSPGAPSFALVVLWILAPPLAVLGGWFAATRVADGAAARVAMALLWGAAPPFWDALMQGRPAAVLLHLLLPWLLYAGAAAHRSWTTAGAASLLLVGVVACAPSIAPALAIVWILALVATILWAKRGIGRVVWVILPTLAMFAPLAVQQISRGTPWGLFADPGAIVAYATGPVAALAAGFANGGGDWTVLFADLGLPADDLAGALAWIPLLVAPVALLALAAPAIRRTRVALFALALAALGVATAVIATHAHLAFVDGEAVAVWPGSGLTLGWMGLVLAAAMTIDAASEKRRWGGLLAGVAVACVVVAIVPQLTALHRGASPLHASTGTTLPAYISAEARDDRALGTLVLTPLVDGGVETTVVWGPSETLGGASTFARTELTASERDEWLARVAGDIISGSSSAVTEPLARAGISFVLLREQPGDPNAPQRVMSLTATASMDQRSGFVRVGETPRGALWRVDDEASARPDLTGGEATSAWLIGASQVALLIGGLLLAIPTRDTRLAVRHSPRRIGRTTEETA